MYLSDALKIKIKALFMRFLRAGICGAVAAMVVVPFANLVHWIDIVNMLNTLAIAGCGGFLTGILMALNKWARWEKSVTPSV